MLFQCGLNLTHIGTISAEESRCIADEKQEGVLVYEEIGWLTVDTGLLSILRSGLACPAILPCRLDKRAHRSVIRQLMIG